MHMISLALTIFRCQCIFVHLDHTQDQYQQITNFKQTVVLFLGGSLKKKTSYSM